MKTTRDLTGGGLRIAGTLVLIAGLLFGLSVALVGPGDSFTPLFAAPALLLAAIAITIWPAVLVDSAIGTAAVLIAALAPLVSLIVWILTDAPAAVAPVQIVGLVAAAVAAPALTAGRRSRAALIVLIVALAAGALLACGADAWAPDWVGVVGAALAALAAVLLGSVLLAAVTMRRVLAERDAANLIG